MTLAKLDLPNNDLTTPHVDRALIPLLDRQIQSPNARRDRWRDNTPEPLPLRLGHVHLKVRDLDCSLPLYTQTS